MSFDPEDSLRVIKTHLEGMSPARFTDRVFIGAPPTAVLPSGFTAILTVGAGGPSGENMLSQPIELWTLRILIYRAQAEGAKEDDALMRFRIPAEIEALLRADYTLGGTVRNVSFGEYGTRIAWTFDEEEIADRPYWTAHIDVPVIVDVPAVTFAP